MTNPIQTKAEKRQKKSDKSKKAPKGAKFSGQVVKMKTSKNYTGKSPRRRSIKEAEKR